MRWVLHLARNLGNRSRLGGGASVGHRVTPFGPNGLIVSGFNSTELGDFTVQIRPSLAAVNVQPLTASAPEPSSLALLGIAAVGFAARSMRRRRKQQA